METPLKGLLEDKIESHLLHDAALTLRQGYTRFFFLEPDLFASF